VSRPGRHGDLPAPPHLIAHRGGSGLAPENTLEAFRQAVDLWRADLIELDVRATADDHCVVFHDASIERVTDGTGDVAAFTLDALREFDAGYRFSRDGGVSFPYRGRGVRVPTIDEVLDALPATPLIIELKTPAVQAALRQAIRRHAAESRIIPAAEHEAWLTQFRDYAGLRSGASEQLRRLYIAHRAHLARWWRPAFETCQVPEIWGRRRIVSPRFVRDLHRLGILVAVWTVDELDDMRRLLAWGVDGVITDRPDRLATVLGERTGRPAPPGASGSVDLGPPALPADSPPAGAPPAGGE
jgi:glycerophosphoryl diester phosphodiesterase